MRLDGVLGSSARSSLTPISAAESRRAEALWAARAPRLGTSRDRASTGPRKSDAVAVTAPPYSYLPVGQTTVSHRA